MNNTQQRTAWKKRQTASGKRKKMQLVEAFGDEQRAETHSVLGECANGQRNKEIFRRNAYLKCLGTHIILLCEGEKARGAAGVAVK
jgi:hypothetical protein